MWNHQELRSIRNKILLSKLFKRETKIKLEIGKNPILGWISRCCKMKSEAFISRKALINKNSKIRMKLASRFAKPLRSGWFNLGILMKFLLIKKMVTAMMVSKEKLSKIAVNYEYILEPKMEKKKRWVPKIPSMIISNNSKLIIKNPI